MQNVTVSQSREAVFSCTVDNLQTYKVGEISPLVQPHFISEFLFKISHFKKSSLNNDAMKSFSGGGQARRNYSQFHY